MFVPTIRANVGLPGAASRRSCVWVFCVLSTRRVPQGWPAKNSDERGIGGSRVRWSSARVRHAG